VHFNRGLKTVNIKDKDVVVQSSETGFTGDKSTWFDD